MSEEELNKLIKECYGVTIDEIEENADHYANKYWETLDKLDEIRQENQQLKEDYNEAVADGTEWESRYYNLQDKWDVTILKLDHENKILKSVLDEIREYIEHSQNYSKEKQIYVNGDDLLQILDKVKE